MQVEQLLASMTPEVYANLKNAVETGKWANGVALTSEQKENAMQAVLLYQSRVEQSDEHMTVGKDGEIVQKSRQQLKQELQHQATQQSTIAKFGNEDI